VTGVLAGSLHAPDGVMYRNCIFCSSDLGANEAIEGFPVGRQVAFDAWKGRLWAVCPRCARWNLAPIEERWEPVEQAEKLFRDARLRVHSENVGLSRLPDGTRLIRVGQALPGELAAWRYGRQLLRRRNRYILGVAGFAAAVIGWNVIPAFAATAVAAAPPGSSTRQCCTAGIRRSFTGCSRRAATASPCDAGTSRA
jgi:hypothetical protein